jgi:hypothetical protein
MMRGTAAETPIGEGMTENRTPVNVARILRVNDKIKKKTKGMTDIGYESPG